MTKTVVDYQNDIANAQIEIGKIQSQCKHDKGYDCVMYSWRVAAYQPSRVCKECYVCLPGITAQESKQVWDGFGMTLTTGETTTIIPNIIGVTND